MKDKISKTILIIFLVTGLISAVSADVEVSHVQATYGEETFIGGNCDDSNCPDDGSILIEECDDTAQLHTDNSAGHWEYGQDVGIPIGGGSAVELRCPPGPKGSFSVYYGTSPTSSNYLGEAGSLEVEYETQGSYWGVTHYDGDVSPNRINRHNFMSDNPSIGTQGHIRVRERNCASSVQNCQEQLEAKSGVILSTERSGYGFGNKVDDMAENPMGGDCGWTTGACHVADMELDSYRSDCSGRCALGHLNTDSDTFGGAADYLLRGEMIVGQEFDPEDEFPEGQSLTTDQKNFHICETDSVNSMVDTFVWSPGDEHSSDYFRCNNQGQWETVEDCPPGYFYEDGQCEPLLEEINVNFFNIDGVPGLDRGYNAGFMIRSWEISKFEDVYGFPATYIGSECWMGGKQERPSDDELVQETRRTASSSGFSNDVQIITGLPERDTETFEEIDKYSCVFSIENPDEGVSLGSNDPCTNSCEEPLITVNKRDSFLSMNYGDLRHPVYITEAFPTEHSYSGYDINDNHYNYHPRVDYYNRFIW